MPTEVASVLGPISGGLGYFIGIYTALVIIRCLLTWFPSVNWSSPPFSVLGQLTDPYLNLFRNVIPPLGGMDLSPMLAIFVLQILGSLL
jgi:YggT family protein